ncbi:unnamed protein product [Protopolystoma xenopodis]|uniref:Uncharacterized protein n=1 Tax=Protopolystoma xenopodis TaxID=117903 RepID=A0A3S5AFU6_9PLAT|nr:unnamed protein product [Protopolystoma xenopodis]
MMDKSSAHFSPKRGRMFRGLWQPEGHIKAKRMPNHKTQTSTSDEIKLRIALGTLATTNSLDMVTEPPPRVVLWVKVPQTGPPSQAMVFDFGFRVQSVQKSLSTGSHGQSSEGWTLSAFAVFAGN